MGQEKLRCRKGDIEKAQDESEGKGHSAQPGEPGQRGSSESAWALSPACLGVLVKIHTPDSSLGSGIVLCKNVEPGIVAHACTSNMQGAKGGLQV